MSTFIVDWWWKLNPKKCKAQNTLNPKLNEKKLLQQWKNSSVAMKMIFYHELTIQKNRTPINDGNWNVDGCDNWNQNTNSNASLGSWVPNMTM
jgi:hypothetical protein